jgi:SAM-dependent methyltransferase
VCADRHRWPVRDGVPLFLDRPASYDDQRTNPNPTNPYNATNLALIRQNPGSFILDYGSGNPRDAEIFDNVIRIDLVHYRSVDVVTNTPRLPFTDDTFDFVVSESVFEHVRDPWHCARELYRVLKPGGRIHIDTAFLFPVHGDPYHFYNMTLEGVAETFKMFRKVDSGVGPHQTCGTAMNVFFNYFLSLIEDEAARGGLTAARGGIDFTQFDAVIPPDKQHIMSAGVYFIGEKPWPAGGDAEMSRPALERRVREATVRLAGSDGRFEAGPSWRRVTASPDLRSALFRPYHVEPRRDRLCAVVLLPLWSERPTRGRLGIEIVSPAATIVAHRVTDLAGRRSGEALTLEFPPIGSPHGIFELRVFVRETDVPVQVVEYAWPIPVPASKIFAPRLMCGLGYARPR